MGKAKLKKRKGLFAGQRAGSDRPSPLLVDMYPKLKGFHAPQREHVKQPMPERT